MNTNPIKKLLVTGSTGLVGSRFLQLSDKNFQITTIGRSNVDISLNLLSEDEVVKTVTSSDADAIVNFAAFTNVDGAEKEKGEKQKEVYLLNAMLPLWLAKTCQDSGKKFYHISTDYVFEGNQDTNPYTEDDNPKPVDSWYAQTKYYGEQNILNLANAISTSAILRISYPYSGLYQRKLDIARVVVEKLQKGEEYFGISDQKIKPTSVDDIAMALVFLLEKNATGIYHVAGNFSPDKYITPFAFAQSIANTFSLDKTLIKPITFEELSKKRVAPRPQHTWLDTKKIESLGLHFTNFDEALKRFINQIIKK